MFMQRFLTGVIASIAVLGATTENADAETWTFENTTIEHPLGTVTGSFTVGTGGSVFDPVESYTIWVNHFNDTPSGGHTGAVLSGPSNAYPNFDSWVVTNANEIDFFYGAKDRLNPMMQLHLVLAYPTPGGLQVSEIRTGSFFRFSPYLFCDECTPATFQAVTGSISGVPEPETYAMLLAGLGVMGAIARRRKANQAQHPAAETN